MPYLSDKTKQYIDSVRMSPNSPEDYKYASDDYIYYDLERQGRLPDEHIADSYKKITAKQPTEVKEKKSASQELSTIESMFDLMIDENSADWVKAGYTRSLTGIAEQAWKGEKRYNVDEMNFNFAEDLGATFLSFLMPLDVLTLWGGGQVGKFFAGKTGTKWLAAKNSDEVLEKIITGKAKVGDDVFKTLNKVENSLLGGMGGAPALALYEGALGFHHAKIEGKDLSGKLKETGLGVLRGGALGFLTGAIGGGMGARAAEISARTKPGEKMLRGDWVKSRIAYGMPGQLTAESSLFTAAEIHQRIMSGEDLDASGVLKSWAHNFLLFGALKGWGYGKEKTLQKFRETKTGKAIKEHMDVLKHQILKKSSEIEKNNKKVMGNVEDVLKKEGIDIPEEIRERLLEADKKTQSAIVMIDFVRKQIDRIDKIVDKGNPDAIQNNTKQISDVFGAIKVAKQLLKDALKGDIQGIHLEINETARKDIEKLHKNLENQLNEMRDSFEKDADFFRERKKQSHEESIDNSSGAQKAKEVLKLVNKIAAFEKKSPEEILNDPSYHVKNPEGVALIGEGGKPVMDVAALRLRHNSNVESKGESPSAQYEKKVLETDIDKAIEASSHLNKNIRGEDKKLVKNEDGTNKTVIDYIKDLKLSKENEQALVLGIAEFFPQRNKTHTGASSIKMLADFIKYLDSIGVKITELSDNTHTQKYVKMMKDKNNWRVHERNRFGEVVAAFFGSGGLEPKLKGFSAKYLGRDAMDNPTIRLPKEKAPLADITRVGTPSPSVFKKIKDKIFNLIGLKGKEGETKNLKGKGQEIEPSMFDAIVDTFYNFGARGVDTLKRLKIENIDWKNGIIKEWSTGEGTKAGGGTRLDLPIKDILPELWNKLEKIKGDRKEGLLFVDAKGKGVKGDSFNAILKMLTEGKDIPLEGKKGYMTLQDFRRAIETDAINMSVPAAVRDFVDRVLVGHSATETRATYRVQDIPGLWKTFLKERERLAKEGREKPEDSPYPSDRSPDAKLQTEKQAKLGKEISKERQESQKKHFESIPAYKNLKITLKKKLGKNNGERILGKIEKHIIEIAEKRSREDTIPHEISHYVKDVLEAFGTAKDKALIKRGMNLFAKDVKRKKGESLAEYNKRVEEAFVQRLGEATLAEMKMKGLGLKERTMKDVKGFKGKLKYFARQFWDRVKDVFGFTSKADVSYIMSKKIFTGKGVPTGREVFNYIESMGSKFQKTSDVSKEKTYNESKKSANGVNHKLERILRDNYGVEQAEIDSYREYHNIGAKGTGWSPTKKDVSLHQLETYTSFLEKKISDYGKTENKKKKNPNTNMVDEKALEYGVRASEVKDITKSLGRTDGDHTKLPPKLKEHLIHLIETYGKKPTEVENTFKNLEQLSEKMPLVTGFARKVGAPVFYILRTKGGKAGRAIADKLIQFDVTFNSEFKGPGMLAVSKIRKLLTREQLDNIWLFDADRVASYRKDKNAPKLTKSQEAFLLEMKRGTIDKETGMADGSNVFRAKHIHNSLMKFYWNAIAKEAKVVNNPAEYEKFKKEFNEKFVRDFFTRRVTKKALDHILTAKDGKYLGAELEKAISLMAERKAKEHDPSKGLKYKEKLKNLKDAKHKEGAEIRLKAIENLSFILTHQYHKVSESVLMERGPLLPEFIDISAPGKSPKLVRTYETRLEKTVEPYIMAVSKYIATLRHFPEYTGLGGKYKLGKPGSVEVLEMKLKGENNLGAYAHDAIKKLLDIKEVDRGGWAQEKSVAFSGLRNFAHFSAAFGLSSPTSGIKNLLIGLPRTFATFGGWNTAIAITKLFRHDTWQEARGKGVMAFGAKTMELGQLQAPGAGKLPEKFQKFLTMEKLFDFNLMTLTENINRIVATEAGKLYFMTKLNVLQGGGGAMGWVTRADTQRVMKDVYKLNESRIEFLKEGKFESKEAQERLGRILRQVEHYSHVSTQGGTSVGQLPLWMSTKLGKPLTLFQRMAYSTTFDLVQNYIKPIKTHGNFVPIVRATIGHSIAGGALGAMYMWLFDQETPVSSKGPMSKAIFNLWRSEMGGLFGMAWDPYMSGSLFGADRGVLSNIMTPVVARNLMTSSEAIVKAFGGERGLKQTALDWLNDTVVLTGQYNKMTKRFKSQEWSNSRRWNERIRQWKNELGVQDHLDKYRINWYYKNLKEKIYFGTEDEIAKTYFAAYAAKVTELEKIPGTTPLGRHRIAVKSIMSSIKSMNPIAVSQLTNKDRVISKEQVFLEWVKSRYGQKGYDDAIKAKTQYKYLLRKVHKVINNRKYWEKYGAYGYMD